MLPRYLGFLEAMLTRRAQPRRYVEVRTINETPATRSQYRAALAERFEVSVGPRSLELRARMARLT